MAYEQYKENGPRPVSISMKPDLARRVTVAAKQRGQTRSAFVRDLVEKELDRPGDNGQHQDDGQNLTKPNI